MIDTDKYEWDSKCRLVVIDGELFQRGACGDYHIPQQLHDKAVAQIVADAPLLLEEVKRLREDNELYLACIHASHFREKPGSAMSKLNQMRFSKEERKNNR